MKRYSFLMRIRPELKAEYKKAHDEIWPDMAKALRESGFHNYSIYFRPDGTLFSYLESDDPALAFEKMGKTEVNARWQKAMDRFFVKKDPKTVGPDIVELEEVFHID
jgi:L-rhamnose mutarotase